MGMGMAQPPHSGKRIRSNTSEFISATPQTTAPALRHSPSINNASVSNLGLYNPTVYNNASYAALAVASGRQTPTAGVPDYTAYSTLDATSNGYPRGALHGRPSPVYQQSYDPRALSAYNVAYGQAHSHNGGLGSPYGQPRSNSMQNGSYAQMKVSHSGSTVPGAYSPPQEQHPSTPILQHTLPHHFGGESYSSQPAAHAAMFQGHAVSYPEPTVNPQYSPPPSQTPEHGTRQLPQTPLQEDVGIEDAQGELEQEISEHMQMESHLPDETSNPPESKCACKKGRGKKKACTSCACSKYGRRCGKHCSCGTACGNPFQDLTAFFGPAARFPKPCDANACFATWLSNQPNVEELDVDLMVDMLLYDDKSWANIKANTKAFKDWEDRWIKAKNSKAKKLKEDREKLEYELLRGALGNCNANDFHGYNYSFCRGQWVPMDAWEHCRECRLCSPSSEWHCEQHGRCTSNRACPGCMGDVLPYSGVADYPVQA
ncbi:hypothetical protein PG994_002070 [Apiospora phragmitis]|uniref:Tesmin/TSO1-like CXC domain-containing protein n=1 Tax=Apiospora phragmitis TaxID=2905665 RepID=A0ABR1WVA0_9PEZI